MLVRKGLVVVDRSAKDSVMRLSLRCRQRLYSSQVLCRLVRARSREYILCHVFRVVGSRLSRAWGCRVSVALVVRMLFSQALVGSSARALACLIADGIEAS